NANGAKSSGILFSRVYFSVQVHAYDPFWKELSGCGERTIGDLHIPLRVRKQRRGSSENHLPKGSGGDVSAPRILKMDHRIQGGAAERKHRISSRGIGRRH